jgi:hypothetical protein
MGQYTDFLFARPSFIEGIARLVDIGHTFDEYNQSVNGEKADLKAIRMDWLAVGADLEAAFRAYEAATPMWRVTPHENRA